MNEIYELYELKEMLMKELKEYGEKGEMSSGALEVIDKLSHAIKNICRIIEEYEGASYGRSMNRDGRSRNGSYGRSYNRSYDNSYEGSYDGSYDDASYARKRDRMGRFSREADVQSMMADLQDLMSQAKDEKTRQEFRRFMSTLESM